MNIIYRFRFFLLSLLLLFSACDFDLFKSFEPDQTIELFVPVLDTLEDGSLTGKVGNVVLVNKAIVYENDKFIEYIVRSQSFGYWDPLLEYKWNLFLLQTNFFYTDQLPASEDSHYNIDSLYMGLSEPYTEYIDSLSADEFERQIFTNTKPGAIGIILDLLYSEDTLVIKYVAPNSPASSAGLEKGMKILEVNDSSVTGDSALERFGDLTAGDSGTALTLTVTKGGVEETFALVKDIVEFPSVLLDTVDQIPHIQVFTFTGQTIGDKSTSDEFQDALRATENSSVTLLDLRSNVGGSVLEVLYMCDEVISSGVIIHEEFRSLSTDSIPRFFQYADMASPGGVGEGRQYILLADAWSASASEIFISALMEAEGTPMVGDTTYGKGIGQIVIKTPGRGWAKVTSLLIKSRNNQVYHGVGIEPTYPTQDSEALARAVELARDMGGGPVSKKSRRRVDLEIMLSELNRRERIRGGETDIIIQRDWPLR
jgi:C-terminal peptidase prc